MPISFEIGDDSRRIIGAYVGTALIPTLFILRDHLASIDRNVEYYTNLFRPLPSEIGAAVVGGVERLSIRTFETNSTLLDHIQAARWAIAYLAYNTMADVWWLLNAMHRRAGQIGARIIELLEQILDVLRSGIAANVSITITTTGGGGFADFLKQLDLWKLLALLAILVGFVVALALAMRLFNLNALLGAAAIALFLASITPLVEKLAGYDWSQIIKIGVGLGALALFVVALGGALRVLTKDSAAALPELTKFIEKLGSLADQMSKLGVGELIKMTAGLAALAGFVAGLGAALRMMNPLVLNALGPLTEFIDHLGALAQKMADLSVGDLLTLTGGLAALAGFVAGLAAALDMMNPLVLNALGPLSEFIDHLGDLGVKLAELSTGKAFIMAGALAALALFVTVLAAALRTLTPAVLNALGPLTDFITRLGDLGMKLAKLSGPQVLAMAGALLALAGFVAILAFALSKISAQTLQALDPLSRFIDTLSSLGLKLASLSLMQILAMAGGLAALALFVAGLEWALSQFDVAVLNALPGLTGLINALKDIALAMAGLGIGELFTMAAAFALIALFVWALAAALKFAEGPLKAIATILTELRGLLHDIVDAGEAVLDFFGGVLGGLFGGGGSGMLGPLLGPLLGPGLGGGLLGPALQLLPISAPITAAPGGGAGLLTAAAGPQTVDQSVNVQGGISVAVNADRLEADSAQMLSDEIVAQLQARLGALRSEQDFRVGARPAAAV